MNFDLLTRAPLFANISVADIKLLLTNIPHKIKRYKPGSTIAISGERVNSLYLVIKGVVKGEMVDYEGRIIKIEDIPAPEALAAGFIFGKMNVFPVNVISVTEVELLIIDKPDFLSVLHGSDIVLLNFLNMISNRSQFLSEKIRFLTFKTIKGKLAHYLLQRVRMDNYTVVMDKTQNEMAEFFGVARPSIGRALGELEDAGFIEVDRKNIRIIDIDGLADLTVD
jgi:CRP/FNR family transcriptional regulator, dissimilatory nitrate respiration regulator